MSQAARIDIKNDINHSSTWLLRLLQVFVSFVRALALTQSLWTFAPTAMGNSESKTELKREVDAAEVAKHAHKQDCWIIINDIVYDATSFLEDHPGGPSIIMIHAGTEAIGYVLCITQCIDAGLTWSVHCVACWFQ